MWYSATLTGSQTLWKWDYSRVQSLPARSSEVKSGTQAPGRWGGEHLRVRSLVFNKNHRLRRIESRSPSSTCYIKNCYLLKELKQSKNEKAKRPVRRLTECRLAVMAAEKMGGQVERGWRWKQGHSGREKCKFSSRWDKVKVLLELWSFWRLRGETPFLVWQGFQRPQAFLGWWPLPASHQPLESVVTSIADSDLPGSLF